MDTREDGVYILKMRWSKEEEDVLKKLYGKIIVDDIAKILNRTSMSVHKKALRLQLKSNLRKYWNHESKVSV